MPYSLLLNACTVHTFCNYTVQLKPNTDTCIHIRTYVRTDKDQQVVKKALTYVRSPAYTSLTVGLPLCQSLSTAKSANVCR